MESSILINKRSKTNSKHKTKCFQVSESLSDFVLVEDRPSCDCVTVRRMSGTRIFGFHFELCLIWMREQNYPEAEDQFRDY